MVVTPTLRGLFGIDIDAQTKTITVNPHLPASWGHAYVQTLPLGNGKETLDFSREGRELIVSLGNATTTGWKLRTDQQGAKPDPKADEPTLRIPIPELEVDELVTGYSQNMPPDAPLPNRPPVPGSRTSRFRIVRSVSTDHMVTLTCEGLAGSSAHLSLLRHGMLVPKIKADTSLGEPDAIISAQDGWAFKDPKAPLLLILNFPSGEGWKTMTITLTW
jgi:hypothetical protein